MTAWFAAVYERCWHFSDTLLYRTSALRQKQSFGLWPCNAIRVAA
jgi:hypothetical protein